MNDGLGDNTDPWQRVNLQCCLMFNCWPLVEKEMATHSSVPAWRIPGMGGLVGCRLWGRTESDMTEVT